MSVCVKNSTLAVLFFNLDLLKQQLVTITHIMRVTGNQKLSISGYKLLFGTFLGPFIQCLLFFSAARSIGVLRVWFFLIFSEVMMFGGLVVVSVMNPELINQRGKWRKIKDTKKWDRMITPFFGIFGYYVVMYVSGLDVGRNHSAHLGIVFFILGVTGYIFGTALLYWAMIVNRHFEVTVRIQNDRNHTVISDGPYTIVRHPGYVGAILFTLSTPFIVGSAWGVIPAVIAVLFLVLRTWLEDKTLCKELDGYKYYSKRTKYRLLPWIW